MNAAATALMEEIPEVPFAYGISDEFRYPRMSFPGVDDTKLICNLVSYSIAHAICSIGETGIFHHPIVPVEVG